MANIRVNERLPGLILQQMRKRLMLYAAFLVNYIKRNKLSRGRRGSVGAIYSPSGDEPPHADTGEMRNSIRWQWKDGDPDTIQVGTNLRYGFVQEFGMTIRARKSYMTIPLSAAALLWESRGGTARTFQGAHKTVVIPGRGANKLIVEFLKKKTIIHYLLAVSVTIRPHPFLRPSLAETRPDMERIFSAQA